MKKFTGISENSIKRLPKYLRYLQFLSHIGHEKTSSAQIAEALGMTASQIRQDLSAFGSYGAQGYGYQVSTLMEEIKKIIGLNITHEIAVIGVGSIGRALLEHMDFGKYNYHVAAAFDVNPEVIGTCINGIEIFSMKDLPNFLEEYNIDICMLTVSKDSAKSVANLLLHNRIPAIWNFTNADLELDETKIIVQNVNFWDSLFVLTYYLESNAIYRSVSQ